MNHFKSVYPLLFGLILLCSCSNPQEKLIEDYEQTINGTKTDLNLKVKNLEKVGEVKASDSLNYYKQAFDAELPYQIQKYETAILRDSIELNRLKRDLEDYKEKYASTKSPDLKAMYKESIERLPNTIRMMESSLKRNHEAIDVRLKEDARGTELEDEYFKMNSFKELGDKVIANKFKATYTINNPLLNGAEQEITKVYLFSPDNKSILGKE